MKSVCRILTVAVFAFGVSAAGADWHRVDCDSFIEVTSATASMTSTSLSGTDAGGGTITNWSYVRVEVAPDADSSARVGVTAVTPNEDGSDATTYATSHHSLGPGDAVEFINEEISTIKHRATGANATIRITRCIEK